jgi:hypothetical protein
VYNKVQLFVANGLVGSLSKTPRSFWFGGFLFWATEKPAHHQSPFNGYQE